ncbi:MFS general substrate transporter [Sarocladium strictum]
MAATAPSDRGSDTAVSEQLRPGTEDVIRPSKVAADPDDYHGSATNVSKDGPSDGHEALAATTSRASTSQYAESRFLRFMTPKRCRWDPSSPPDLPMPLALLYALTSTFTVANIYYCQPILNIIAEEFGVSYEMSSQSATLIQAGYAFGLIFVLPLGDMLRRRPFIIGLIWFTATVWIGLCLTNNFMVFRIVSFICGITTVTPQLMIPLVGEYAPANKKGFVLSIIVSGLLLGMLIARLLSGILANYTSWRNIYWFACGAQYLIGTALFFFMPDYPSTNSGLGYFKALWTILCFIVTEPLLVQASLIVYFCSAVFTSFWTTLTFLLASPPYEYSSLVIGLFALLGIAAIIFVPLWGKVIDRFVPLFSILIAELILLATVIIGTFTGTFTVAGPVIAAIGIDVGIQVAQVANRTAIFAINPKARNRTNTAYMAFAFAGQLSGTAIGNRLYAKGGWRYSGGFAIAFVGASILVALARGPHEKRWVGWRGGWAIRKKAPAAEVPEPVDSGSDPEDKGASK